MNTKDFQALIQRIKDGTASQTETLAVTEFIEEQVDELDKILTEVEQSEE